MDFIGSICTESGIFLSHLHSLHSCSVAHYNTLNFITLQSTVHYNILHFITLHSTAHPLGCHFLFVCTEMAPSGQKMTRLNRRNKNMQLYVLGLSKYTEIIPCNQNVSVLYPQFKMRVRQNIARGSRL